MTGRGKMWKIYESNGFVEYEVTIRHVCQESPWLSARWRYIMNHMALGL